MKSKSDKVVFETPKMRVLQLRSDRIVFESKTGSQTMAFLDLFKYIKQIQVENTVLRRENNQLKGQKVWPEDRVYKKYQETV